MKAITLAITGASGAVYAKRLLECLVSAEYRVYLMISNAAQQVLTTEIGQQWPSDTDQAKVFFKDKFNASEGQVQLLGREQWFSPVASGSSAPKQMVICPCSMGTLASIACGLSDNLIERSADVVIKERGELILVPREMPLSVIHLENMLTLARLGVTIMPAAPGFYHQPTQIEELVDHVVARILDHLGIDQSLMTPWGGGV